MYDDKEAVETTRAYRDTNGIEAYQDDGLYPVHSHGPPIVVPQEERYYHTGDEGYSAPKPTICGLPRKTFYLVLGIGVLIAVALAVGLGVGLAVGLRSRESSTTTTLNTAATTNTLALASTTSSSLSTTLTSMSPSSSTSTVSSSSISTSTSAAATATSTNVISRAAWCPGNNATTVLKTGGTYKILCDVAVEAPNKINLSNNYQASFAACLDQCQSMNVVGTRNDISAVYNWAGAGSQVPGTCWCVGGTAPNQGATIAAYPGNDLALIQSS